jgi:nitrite reductase/ring-hydroxylating ferredoxin subunit
MDQNLCGKRGGQQGKRICLVKHEGKFLAVSDRCTHNGESLSKGKVNHLGEIVCPWHGHQFNLKSGREAQERSSDLECFPVNTEQSVFIWDFNSQQ